jgi:hypothetical protein
VHLGERENALMLAERRRGQELPEPFDDRRSLARAGAPFDEL